MGLSRFKKRSKFQKFQLNNFTLTCSNEGKMNSVWPVWLAHKKYNKNENVGQNYLKKHLNSRILVKYCVMAISRNSNRFLMGIEKSLSQKGIIKVYENIPVQP